MKLNIDDEIKQKNGICSYICKRCGKEMKSLYLHQLSYNIKAHQIICKMKKVDQ